ncbi:MAG: hypothetical protein ACRDSE_09510 [Pseudonocardiaceae bacterium]
MSTTTTRGQEMNLLSEQLAMARIRELEDLAEVRRPEVVTAIREHAARRRAYRWILLSRWAQRRADRAFPR